MANDFQYGDERDAFSETEAPSLDQLGKIPNFLSSGLIQTKDIAPAQTEPVEPFSMAKTYRRIFDALGFPPPPDNSGVMSQIFSHQPPYSYLKNRPSRPSLEEVAQSRRPPPETPSRSIPQMIADFVNPSGEDLRYTPKYTLPDVGMRIGRTGTPAITTEETRNTTPFVTERPEYIAPNKGRYRFDAVRPEYIGSNDRDTDISQMEESKGRAHLTKPIMPRTSSSVIGNKARTKQEEPVEEEDTGPGSLAEAKRLFPGRPLQQAIYYTDPGHGKEGSGGKTYRLGVGADTKGLNPDYISRIWEPADMSFQEKLVRGAFEKASGGSVDSAHRIMREKSTPCHAGLITMAVGGRTDHIPMNVLEGSYVLPADIVSGLGEGNTLAGSRLIAKMFETGPFGVSGNVKFSGLNAPSPKLPGSSSANSPYGFSTMNYIAPIETKEKADGGPVSSGKYRPVPIVAAGGEYVIHPDVVKKLGNGDIDKGHNYLDNFVKGVRRHLIKTLSKLPGPRRD